MHARKGGFSPCNQGSHNVIVEIEQKLLWELEFRICAWYMGRQSSVNKMEDGIPATALINMHS